MLARVTFDDDITRLALLAIATGVLAGALGSWIVVRRQAFLAHASGATAFAGAAIAGAAGVAALPAAMGAAGLVAVITGTAARRRPELAQVATGLALACGLALGVIATRSGAPVTGTSVLLGSTLLASDADVLTALATAAAAAILAALYGRWWLVGAVQPHGGAGAWSGASPMARSADLILLVLIGIASAALLPVAGALLAGTLLVVPAATAQRIVAHPRRLMLVAGLLATAELLAALTIAQETDLPPGAAAALTAAAVDVAVAGALLLRRQSPPSIEVAA